MRKGTHHTNEAKIKNSEAHKGQIPVNKGIPTGKPAWNKGMMLSEKEKQTCAKARSWWISPLKGIPKSKEHNRKNSEAQKGEKNHNWKGGISFLPYCSKFNKPLKEKIREKYGRKCFLCSKPESENGGVKLSVHHIDYDKEQGCNGKTFELVPLCGSHNSIVNGNREFWQTEIMNKLRDK